MVNLWWLKSDCITTWTAKRIHKILLLHLWRGPQYTVPSLLKKGLACQKISGTRNHECGKSTTSGTEKNFVAIDAFKVWSDEKFVKAMNQEEAAYNYLWETFLRLNEAKLKEGIFFVPKIRDYIKDEYFEMVFQGNEKAAWESIKLVVKGYWETEGLKTMRSW